MRVTLLFSMFFLVASVLVGSCNRGGYTTGNKGNIIQSDTTFICMNTHRAIFEGFDTIAYTDMVAGKWLIHPELKYRDTLFGDFQGGFKKPMDTVTGIQLDHPQSCKLTIPDSARHIFGYYTDDCVYPREASMPIVCFLSPLLKTSEEGIFLQQMYMYFTTSEDLGLRRYVLRCFLKFKIEDGKISRFGPVFESEELYVVD